MAEADEDLVTGLDEGGQEAFLKPIQVLAFGEPLRLIQIIFERDLIYLVGNLRLNWAFNLGNRRDGRLRNYLRVMLFQFSWNRIDVELEIIFNLSLKRPLLIQLNQVSMDFNLLIWSGLLPGLRDLSFLDQQLQVPNNFLSGMQILWKLSLIYKLSAFEYGKIECLAQQDATSVLLQWMQSVKEHQLIELENEFSQYLLAKVGGRLFIIEENNATIEFSLAGSDLSHKELEVINVQLGLIEFFLLRWELATRPLR